MADKAKGTTNDTPNSCVPVDLTCTELWSLAQQFAYLRLCEVRPTEKTGLKCHNIYTEDEVDLLDDYRIRAKRIAATYARLYLETESDAYSNPDVMGRHAWYAFGALASKTVFCILDFWSINDMPTLVYERFGKGNFWLFMDIAPTAWMYNFSRQDFDTCKKSRNTNNLVPEVKEVVKSLPWADEVLPEIKNMPISDEIMNGFETTKILEDAIRAGKPMAKLRQQVLENLLEIAKHEQGAPVLQTIVYNKLAMQAAVKVQRFMGSVLPDSATNVLMPKTQFVFTPRCDLLEGESEEWRSLPHEGMIVEDYNDRMNWIRPTAKQCAKLLTQPKSRPSFLDHLRTIAGWVDLDDPVEIVDQEIPMGP